MDCDPVAFVAKRAIGNEGVLRHVINLRGMTSETHSLVRPRPVIVHIAVASATFYTIYSVLGTEPLVESHGSLLLVALHAVLLAELHTMAIRQLARR
jgi:hypothetical protein